MMSGVVPASAGVAPAATTSRSPRASCPRICEGCSLTTGPSTDHSRSFPRPRGLLRPGRVPVHSACVVPAPAGVARSRTPSASGSSGRLRARGGSSPLDAAPRPPSVSSPRLRGLLGRHDVRGRRRVPRPTPAGGCGPAGPSSQPRLCGRRRKSAPERLRVMSPSPAPSWRGRGQLRHVRVGSTGSGRLGTVPGSRPMTAMVMQERGSPLLQAFDW